MAESEVLEGLTPEQDAGLAAEVAFPPATPETIELPSGYTWQQFIDTYGGSSPTSKLVTRGETSPNIERDRVLGTWLTVASDLTNDELWKRIDEGPNMPAQPFGLAYALGAKDPSNRFVRRSSYGPGEDGSCCPEKVAALDCSGLISYAAKSPTFNPPAGSANQGLAANWNKALGTSNLKMVQYSDAVSRDLKRIKTGDLLAWPGHIGIAYVTPLPVKRTLVVHSIGRRGGPQGCSLEQFSDTDCNINLKSDRGPKIQELASTVKWVSPNYRRLRLVPKFWLFDFEASSVAPVEVVSGSVITAPRGQKYLGPFGNNGTSFKLEGVGPHQKLRVSFTLHILQTWDGSDPVNGPDTVVVKANGVEVFASTFSNTTGSLQSYPAPGSARGSGSSQSESLGYARIFPPSWADTTYNLTLEFAHTSDDVDLQIFGRNLEPVSNESFGLDNVRITPI